MSSSQLQSQLAESLRHRIRPMAGRDPDDRTRSSTSLELLYDLTYVVAFGVAAEQLAAGIEHGDIGSSIGAYAFALFTVSWAWISFTWLSSAYGNDDALFRVATFVQMIGVIIVVFGLPGSFAGAAEGESPNNALLVVGYTVMRLPQLALWIRAARHDSDHRRISLAYVAMIAVGQTAWASTLFLPWPTEAIVAAIVVIALAELVAPAVVEQRLGRLPWNPAHVAERFSLLTLITLGEVIAATAAAVGALVTQQGWSLPAIVVTAGGILVAAALWWAHFLIPSRLVLPLFPQRTMAWRYAHLPMFGAIAAIGAGLRIMASAVGEPEVDIAVLVLAFTIPVAVVLLLIFVTWSVLMGARDLSHVPLFALAGSPMVAAAVVGLVDGWRPFDAERNGDLTILVVTVGLVTLGCVLDVVGHERVGYRHTLRALEGHA
ncbi:low temperature requirement protein A [Naasia lichenicola]|uniref:Low temperature requirement protein A n=1 Tax=Naasia lichenicola TaxID=2565933 RepID=A0A4S4FQD1_9MICO|nr:low temperature requirement protein A [Naasia lichenicola]THG31586.1 low temperature requirement protein A [Naasia lichenicola]